MASSNRCITTSRRAAAIVSLAAAISALCACSGSDDDKAPAAAAPPAPVEVAKAELGESSVIVRSVGNVESKAMVMLRPQVTGAVQSVEIQDGADVEAGTVLIKFDSRPFEAQVREQEAFWARAKALASDARAAAQQFAAAQERGASSQREMEQAQARATAAEAEMAQYAAAIETAKLQVEYCTIRAPFACRLGESKVKPGTVVKENETDLIALSQVAPIELAFSVPETWLDEVRAAMAEGPVRVEALASGENATPAVGTLTFIDHMVDTQTGAVRLKGTFDNKDGRLWPGEFMNVRLIVRVEKDCVLIPQGAVIASQQGQAVYVVKPDQTVELRPVTVRRSDAGMSVIDKGIAAGETVVTQGQLRLGPDVKVQVKGKEKA